MQVATVNASTSLRMKKRGKVPPRLDTLFEFYISKRPSNKVQNEGTYVARRVI